MANLKRFIGEMFVEPLRYRRFGLFLLRFSLLMRDRTNGRYDRGFTAIWRIFYPPTALPPSTLLPPEQIKAIGADLKKNGSRILDFRLPASELAELLSALPDLPVYAARPTDALPAPDFSQTSEHPWYSWYMRDIAAHPVLKRLLSDSLFHQIAQDYLGCRPQLTSINIWLSPHSPKHYDANEYHYDNDGPGFLKFFIYLNDITADSGPHRFIRGSQAATKPKGFSRARRYQLSELLDVYGQDSEIIYTATAGTIIAEDTSGFHAGSPVKSGYRVMLQLQYAIIDIPHEQELCGMMQRSPLAGLTQSLQHIVKKFYTAG